MRAIPFLVLACAAQGVFAFTPFTPQVDLSPLPGQARTWVEPNPLRGSQDAIAIGRTAFNQTCAHCHGMDANGSRMPAPDLRRLGLGCKRIKDDALRQRCTNDTDAYFIKSVRYGKEKFGIVHMPAWEPYLKPELVWSLRTFIENAPR
jgi:hypothetical protein